MKRVAGLGCRKGATVHALRNALQRASGSKPAALATIPARAVEVRALALELDLPLHLVEVAGIATPTRSARVEAIFGTGSVAEAAALAACGTGACIVRPRVTSPCGHATAAIAEIEETS